MKDSNVFSDLPTIKQIVDRVERLEEQIDKFGKILKDNERKSNDSFLFFTKRTDSLFEEVHSIKGNGVNEELNEMKPFDNQQHSNQSVSCNWQEQSNENKIMYSSATLLETCSKGCKTKHVVVHVEGLPRTRISQLKKFLTEITSVERDQIANIGYVSSEIVEAVIEREAIAKFILSFKKHKEFRILQGTPIIFADKAGILRRLKRVLSEKVKNEDLKEFYKYLEYLLTMTNYTEQEVREVTADAFLKMM
ncbi:hypothetical protein EHP00_1371 [Ecytonucleospora hepatopenaei]|uniref:Uncharacterized protein n=1 Tax=Ecytonucleospora hepatopenaei TaxID=646526 RepID=A0A1W0E2W9_9MICR|nr:hypothetical protein EHP00_1371 [Ecytonucleospora hepatopenaei]